MELINSANETNKSLWNSVLGHQNQKKKLWDLSIHNKIPHAFTFVGKEGVGKFQLALAFAQMLICQKNKNFFLSKNNSIQHEEDIENLSFLNLDSHISRPLNILNEPCGICGPCIRISKRQSESLLIIEPEKSMQIKLEAVKAMIPFLSFSFESAFKIVIIDQAHRLNSQAANSILKTLEEPPQKVIFILTAPDVRTLLPTLRSRCQVMTFQALPLSLLQQIRPGLPDWIYKSSRGQVATMLQLCEKWQTTESENSIRIEHINHLIQFWNSNDFLNELENLSLLKDRNSFSQLVRHWQVFIRDLLFLKWNQIEYVLNKDLISAFKEIAHLQSDSLIKFQQELFIAEQNTDKCDLRLMIESLWLRFANE